MINHGEMDPADRDAVIRQHIADYEATSFSTSVRYATQSALTAFGNEQLGSGVIRLELAKREVVGGAWSRITELVPSQRLFDEALVANPRIGATRGALIAKLTPATPELIIELPDQAKVLGAINEICKSLDLGVRVAAELVGVGNRRWHEYRSDPLPLPKLLAAARLADVLARFYSNEPEILSQFFKTDEEEAISLLVSGRYIEFAQRIEDLRAEIVRHLAAVPELRTIPRMPGGDMLRRIAEFIRDRAAYNALVDLLAPPAPGIAVADMGWRRREGLLVEAEYQNALNLDPVSEQFEFILMLNEEDLESFRTRAQAFLDNIANTPEGWAEFLRMESERAAASYAPEVAELAPAIASDEGLQPYASEIEEFESIGIDLATGERIRERR